MRRVVLSLTSIALAGSLWLLVACERDREEVHERAVVVNEPAPAPAPIYYAEPPPSERVIVVREAPPPVIVEGRPPPPATGYTWVNGYWCYDNGHYAWCKGRYIRTVSGRRFVPAEWHRVHNGWEFRSERWVER